jgi:hypothetical protein
MKIGFTGTRKGMSDRQKEALKQLLYHISLVEDEHIFIHGGCHGADQEADNIVLEFRYSEAPFRIIVHPGDDSQYKKWIKRDNEEENREVLNPKPYLVRNKEIVNSSEILLVAPLSIVERLTGSGTWMTRRYALKVEKPVIILDP